MERIASVIRLFKAGGRTQEDNVAIFSTFNPSAMPSDLIEGTFVQREEVARRLVEIFEESATRESKHNVLYRIPERRRMGNKLVPGPFIAYFAGSLRRSGSRASKHRQRAVEIERSAGRRLCVALFTGPARNSDFALDRREP